MNNKYNKNSKVNENHKYRFSTKDSIVKEITWTKDMKYIDLGEFKTFFQCFIPKTISERESKSKIYTILVSYASLNKKKIKKETLLKLAEICNSRIIGEKFEDDLLIQYVEKAYEDRNTFKPKDNSSVRYLKNPIHEFNIVEMKKETVKLRKESDYKLMLDIVKSWDFEKDGSPTQENLGIKLGYSRRTMIRKFKDKEGLSEFFKFWEELKSDYKSKLFKSESKPKKEIKLNIRKKDVKVINKRNNNIKVKKQIKIKEKQIIKLRSFNDVDEGRKQFLRKDFETYVSKFKLCQLE